MHSGEGCRNLADESRDRLSRFGCGEIITRGRQKLGRRSSKKYGTDAVNGFIIIGQTMRCRSRLLSVKMSYGIVIPPLNKSPLSEQRRNWVMRVRYGPQWSSYKPEFEDSDDDFTIKGKTMNTLMRLPQITPRDVTIHRRQLAGRQRERISFMAINSVRQSVESLHMEESPSTTNYNSSYATRRDVVTYNKWRPDSLDVRMLQAAPDNIPRRRWSDGAVTVPAIATIEPRLTPSLDRALAIGATPATGATQAATGTNALDTMKPGSSAIQSTDEILREYTEFARRREGLGEGRIIRSSSYNHPEWPAQGNVQRKQERNFIKVNLPPTSTVDNEDIQKQQIRNISKLNVIKHRRKVLIPSGDGTGSRNSSLERIPTLGRNGSVPTLLNRKSSRMLSRKFSLQKKSDTALKNKKCQPPKPDSPPPGPSEEEMQELQELPVIRKFLKMPKSRPKVVCFDYPGVDLTHMDVKTAIEKVIPNAFESGKVVSIQFENVNVKLATGGLDNRWLIELKDFTTRNLLIKNGLAPECTRKSSLTDFKVSASKNPEKPSTSADEGEKEEITLPQITYPKKVEVKLNDTVAMEEYKLYLRRTAAEEKLQNVILLCTGRGGDKLLNTML